MMQLNPTFLNTTPTFLTHFFGRGLEDRRYVVERYRTMADGDIRHTSSNGTKGGCKAKRTVASLRTVKQLRPERNEVIICTAVNGADSGVQYWGWLAMGLWCDRRQKRR